MLTPTISLSPTSGPFGSTFTATGTNFSGSESVSLHLLSNPSSAPADCSALRNASGSVNLGSSNASSGSVSVSSVSVTSARFVEGNGNYLCLHGGTSSTSSPVTQFTVSIPTGTISLSPSSGRFGSTFTASGSGFSGSERVSLHLLSNPASAPADCAALRNASGSVNLGSATASSGSVSVSGVSVSNARFVVGNQNYLCLYGNTSLGASPVTQFTVQVVPTITLTPSSGMFDSTFTAAGTNFAGSERVSLHLLANPASVPGSCSALRNASGSVNLGTANASGGTVSVSNVSVSDTQFVSGDGNYLCLYGETSTTASPVRRFTVSAYALMPSSDNLALRKNTSTTFTVRLGAAPSKTTTWLLRTNPAVAALRVGPEDPFNPPPDGYEPELTFTPSNWHLPQTVTVTATAAIRPGETLTARLSSVFAYGDWDYRQARVDIPLTVTGPPPNEFVLSRSFLAMQSGESRGLTVRLKDPPPAPARGEAPGGVWTLASTLDVGIEPAIVSFDRDNWDIPQHIVITGHSPGQGTLTAAWADGHTDLAHLAFSVRLEVTGPGPGLDVSLWNGADRDGFIRLQEGGPGGGFGVSLREAPTGNVTVSVESDLAAVHAHPHALTFTPDNWRRRQSIGLQARPDHNAADESLHLHLVARGGGYRSVSAQVRVCVADAEDRDTTCTFREAPGGSRGKPPPDDPGTPGITPVDETGETPGDDPGITPPVEDNDPGRTPPGETPGEEPGIHPPDEEDPGRQPPDDKPDEKPGETPGDEPGITPPDEEDPGRKPPDDKPGDDPGETPGEQPGITPPGHKPGEQPGETPGEQPGDEPGISPPGKTDGGDPGDKAEIPTPARLDQGEAALSQQSRTLGLAAIGVLSGRGNAAPGSSLTLAGRTVPLGALHKGPHWDSPATLSAPYNACCPLDSRVHGNGEWGTGTGWGGSHWNSGTDWSTPDSTTPYHQGSTMNALLNGSRFELASQDGATRLWGQGDASLGTGMVNRFLGVERNFSPTLLAGAALSVSDSAGSFGLNTSESVSTSLSSAYQYLRYTPAAQTEVWSLTGAGKGKAAFTDELGTIDTDLSMTMLAFGSRHAFGEGTVWGFTPQVSADGFLVRLRTGERTGLEGLRALAGTACRLRAGATLSRPFNDSHFTPTFGVGLLHEADTRGVFTRTEVRTGLTWAYQRLTLDGTAHLWTMPAGTNTLNMTGSQPESWGARLTARWAARPDGLGFSAELDALTGLVADAPVWEHEDTTARAHVTQTRLGVRAGYGFATRRAQWTPWSELRLTGHEQVVREGLRLSRGALSLDLHGEHRLTPAGTDHGFRLDVSTRF